VDDWLDKYSDENNSNRSDVVNRAVKVYAAKMANGEWTDSKFKDKIDQKMDNMT